MRQTIAMRRHRRRLGPPLRSTPREEREMQLVGELSQRRMRRFDSLPIHQRQFEANANEGMAGEPVSFQIELHRFLWRRQAELNIRGIDDPPPDLETLNWDFGD